MIAREFIDNAYNLIEITTISDEDRAYALDQFNFMLSSFVTEGLLFAALVEDIHTLTSGKANYTIGMSADADINIDRAVLLRKAYIRDGDSDYEVDTTESLEEYIRRRDKNLPGRPRHIFYERTFPLAEMFLYPTPDSAYELHMFSRKHIDKIESLDDEVDLPREYDGLINNLCIRIAPRKRVQIRPEILALASNLLEGLRKLNRKPVPTASFDRAITWRPYR